MRLANALCRFVEVAVVMDIGHGRALFAAFTASQVPSSFVAWGPYRFPTNGGVMAETVTSLVQQFASMKPNEFSPAIEPKWSVAERLVAEVRAAVEKKHLTPLDGARVISSITATLFGYDEFILREVSAETFLASSARR